jgi:hypothetical protein
MEVVIALTILGMITATLFSIIQGSVRAAAQIEQLQRENDGINRFLELCRKTFTTLPSTATLTLTALDANVDAGQELTISGAPNCFGFGMRPISYSDTVLGLRPDPAGATDGNEALLQYLCLSREDLIALTDSRDIALRQEISGLAAPDEQGRYWMPLLPDVVSLKWRFYQEQDDTWLEEWSESEWPQLIEVQLLMRDRLTPLRMVYSLPVIQITAGTGGGGTQATSAQGGSAGGAAAGGAAPAAGGRGQDGGRSGADSGGRGQEGGRGAPMGGRGLGRGDAGGGGQGAGGPVPGPGGGQSGGIIRQQPRAQ